MADVLDTFDEEMVDMIFADPPYFLSSGGITCSGGKMVSVDKGVWDKSLSFVEKHEYNKEWLLKCKRIMKPNATIW
ncbi:site-specific DNA-methyltransferase, partial [Staphylococcus pseudintermedius]|nr:site-specific DNA-methyltransferase [Staphylococcus pseudintermedius]